MGVLLLSQEITRVQNEVSVSLDALGLAAARLDRLRDGDGASRHIGVEPLDHTALELHDALVPVLRQVERGNDLLRLRDLFSAGREGLIAGGDLVWMDQGLAVESHRSRLVALLREALRIGEV